MKDSESYHLAFVRETLETVHYYIMMLMGTVTIIRISGSLVAKDLLRNHTGAKSCH